MKPKILIIGAGFTGIFAAKKLDQLLKGEAQITLVSKYNHFEYHASMYRILADESPMQACIPLAKIFKDTEIQLIEDIIVDLDKSNNTAHGKNGAKYQYDYALVALGSENAYYGIQQMSNYAHSFRSINDALKLTDHIHNVLVEKKDARDTTQTQIVVVGGGPNGVEIAAELAIHCHDLALIHNLDSKKIKIKIIEAKEQILPQIPPEDATYIQKHLAKLGVEVNLGSKIEKALETGLIINGETITTQTVIWTAGTNGHHLYKEWGFTTSPAGKVQVDQYLKAESNIFVGGDAADTPGSGTAWPAVDQGELIAKNIVNAIQAKPLSAYTPTKYPTLIPIGQGWAYAKVGKFTFWGLDGWIVRQFFTIKFLSKLTNLKEAIGIMRYAGDICARCKICEQSLALKTQTQYKQ